ncbi:MAG: YcaQ family DNA glycosylase [Chloroflexi bacterium]|nr:YcaQ family DNA glycosylase [Chloroflexota bacterium]
MSKHPLSASSAQAAPVEQLSAEEARLIALRAQGLAGQPVAGGVAGVLRRVGAVQLDTISVLARSHELVAYARLGPVGRDAVEQALWGQPAAAVEYHTHANAVIPVETWPYFAFRRRAWRVRARPEPAAAAVAEVRARLREGPLTVSEAGGGRSSPGWWNWSEAKLALELLYLRGEAVCTTRRAWKRVYDLPERALPESALAADPSDEECFRHLVSQSARALGVGTRRDIAEYFRVTLPASINPPGAPALLDAAIAGAGLVAVRVEGWDAPAFADRAALAPPSVNGVTRTTLLSPFDSLIWERKRTERVFGFPLSLEAYKPKADRIHGYFSMPLLAGGRLVGRVDPAREGTTLVARRVSLDDPAALDALAAALREAAAWTGCEAVRVDEMQPKSLLPRLRKALR